MRRLVSPRLVLPILYHPGRHSEEASLPGTGTCTSLAGPFGKLHVRFDERALRPGRLGGAHARRTYFTGLHAAAVVAGLLHVALGMVALHRLPKSVGGECNVATHPESETDLTKTAMTYAGHESHSPSSELAEPTRLCSWRQCAIGLCLGCFARQPVPKGPRTDVCLRSRHDVGPVPLRSAASGCPRP